MPCFVSDLHVLSDQQNIGFTFLTIAPMAESREPKIPEFWLLKLRDSKSSKSGTPYICHPPIQRPCNWHKCTYFQCYCKGASAQLYVPGVSLMGRPAVGSTWRRSSGRWVANICGGRQPSLSAHPDLLPPDPNVLTLDCCNLACNQLLVISHFY